ncbi:acyl-CoA dehydrogenase family protein, partial [Bacillus pumilus]|uniref:acyl-CoA dehydrogenase family protein n=1 Tax=Bacillus pumilus TaxID=1408 RepID=UPI0034D9727A
MPTHYLAYLIPLHHLSTLSPSTPLTLSPHTSLPSSPIYTFPTHQQKHTYLKPLPQPHNIPPYPLTHTPSPSHP